MLRKEHDASSLMKDQKRTLCISRMTGMPHAVSDVAVRHLERPLSSKYVCPADDRSWPEAVFRGPSPSDIVCSIKYRLLQLSNEPPLYFYYQNLS